MRQHCAKIQNYSDQPAFQLWTQLTLFLNEQALLFIEKASATCVNRDVRSDNFMFASQVLLQFNLVVAKQLVIWSKGGISALEWLRLPSEQAKSIGCVCYARRFLTYCLQAHQ